MTQLQATLIEALFDIYRLTGRYGQEQCLQTTWWMLVVFTIFNIAGIMIVQKAFFTAAILT